MLKVKLSSFEGPLDLLLHLIEKAEVDIYEISVAEIADQYMEYIRQAEREQLEIAGEYLVMAATLLSIKSRMLLPSKGDEGESSGLVDEEEEQLKQALMERLAQYKQFKEIVPFFRSKEMERSQIFTRPAGDLKPYRSQEEDLVSGEVTLFDLVGAFLQVLAKKKREPVNTIQKDELTLPERMEEMRTILKKEKQILFSQLFGERLERPLVVTTFLALLELIKTKEVVCFQERLFGEIIISLAERETDGS